MIREQPSKDLSQKEKYLSFTKAFGSIDYYVKHKNFLAAYVIAFSILEDRMLAAYIVCYKHKHNHDLSLKKLNNVSLHKLIGKLQRLALIDNKFRDELVAINDERNRLIHLLMWKLDEIDVEVVSKIRTTINKIETIRRHFIRPPKPKKKSNKSVN